MMESSYTNIWLASLAFYFILKSFKGPDLASKIEVIYATSAVLYYKFHTIAFLIKNMVKSSGKCGDTSRT